MDHRTDPTEFDTALTRILAEPTRARLLALATATALEQDAFLVIDGWQLTAAIDTAAVETLPDTLPEIVAGEATARLHTALPQALPHETAGEYALRLRTVAKGL